MGANISYYPELSSKDIPKLEALRDSSDDSQGWHDLIEGIERFEKIQVCVDF